MKSVSFQARSLFGLTMFGDNRIIVVGGMGADKNALDSIEELSEDGTTWTTLSKDLVHETLLDLLYSGVQFYLLEVAGLNSTLWFPVASDRASFKQPLREKFALKST